MTGDHHGRGSIRPRAGIAPDELTTDVRTLVAAIGRSPIAPPELAAPNTVLTDIITGEGPTAQDRVHFSRAIDADDAALWGRQADNVDIEILEWIASHVRGKRHLTRSSH